MKRYRRLTLAMTILVAQITVIFFLCWQNGGAIVWPYWQPFSVATLEKVRIEQIKRILERDVPLGTRMSLLEHLSGKQTAKHRPTVVLYTISGGCCFQGNLKTVESLRQEFPEFDVIVVVNSGGARVTEAKKEQPAIRFVIDESGALRERFNVGWLPRFYVLDAESHLIWLQKKEVETPRQFMSEYRKTEGS